MSEIEVPLTIRPTIGAYLDRARDWADDAEQIFMALAASAPAQQLFLDVPESNGQARAMAKRHGMAPVFETGRMYAGLDTALPPKRIDGITTLELG